MLKFTFLSLLIWGLAIQTSFAQGGATCAEATTATTEESNYSHNSFGEQWFKYTATMNGKVIVSSLGQTTADTYVEIYDGCDQEPFTFSNDFRGKQSEVSFEVISGLSYWICWKNYYTSQDFEWSLIETAVEQGDFCSSAISVTSGNLSSTIYENNYKWFSYTASQTGKITVGATGTNAGDCKIAIFDDCSYTSSLNNDDNWNPSKVAFEGEAGQTYLIAIHNTGTNATVNWSVEEGSWIMGERCSDPFDIVVLDNSPINHDSGTDKWYRFIAFQDGEITISAANLTTEDTYLEVYEGCGEERIAFSDDAVGLQSELVLEVKANQAYYIKWDDIFQPEQYAWSLKTGNQITTDVSGLESRPIGVYPNPSAGPVTVDLRGFDSELVTVSVINISGVPVKMLKLTGGEKVTTDFSDLQTGVYQIVMESQDVKEVVRFLKK